ncbi:hypothetical protein TIFTF001_037247 [Ficus carica]|uniref:Uncharacterized protein n=1 Tax=Ficus carica TaxID=3494 RepID=A0AA88E9E6_FICCA|nr:hypothetical protein TIFTF001_037247 [Ficus carica]
MTPPAPSFSSPFSLFSLSLPLSLSSRLQPPHPRPPGAPPSHPTPPATASFFLSLFSRRGQGRGVTSGGGIEGRRAAESWGPEGGEEREKRGKERESREKEGARGVVRGATGWGEAGGGGAWGGGLTGQAGGRARDRGWGAAGEKIREIKGKREKGEERERGVTGDRPAGTVAGGGGAGGGSPRERGEERERGREREMRVVTGGWPAGVWGRWWGAGGGGDGGGSPASVAGNGKIAGDR